MYFEATFSGNLSDKSSPETQMHEIRSRHLPRQLRAYGIAHEIQKGIAINSLVRSGRQAWIHSSQLDAWVSGRRLRWKAGHRNLQHLVGADPCNAHFRDLAERVKRGVWEAGGLPVEFPVMSLGETNLRPSAMLFRNLVSMDVEESVRANPIDAVVLLCGCDKTVPALIMGAASCDLPTLVISGGPMLNGKLGERTSVRARTSGGSAKR